MKHLSYEPLGLENGMTEIYCTKCGAKVGLVYWTNRGVQVNITYPEYLSYSDIIEKKIDEWELSPGGVWDEVKKEWMAELHAPVPEDPKECLDFADDEAKEDEYDKQLEEENI